MRCTMPEYMLQVIADKWHLVPGVRYLSSNICGFHDEAVPDDP